MIFSFDSLNVEKKLEMQINFIFGIFKSVFGGADYYQDSS